MKTTSLFIAILVTCTSLFAGNSAELKYKLEENKTYRVKTVSTVDRKMTMQGRDQNIEILSTVYFSLKALKNTPEFIMAEVKFDTIINSISMPQMYMHSGEKGDMKSENPVDVTNCILNRLSNSTLLIKMDYTGHVQEIVNQAVIEQTVMEDIDSITGKLAMMKDQLKMTADAGTLKGMIESATAYLPNKEIKVGESWTSDFINKAGGIGMKISAEYKLKELSKKEATLSAQISIEPGDTKPTIMNGAEITNELKGMGKADMVIDPATGWIISSTAKSQLSGNMNVNAPGNSMQIPLEIISNTTSTVIE